MASSSATPYKLSGQLLGHADNVSGRALLL
jgi:hypothetical protein